MINDKNQSQKIGPNSKGYQSNRDLIVNNGISYSDARDIALDVFKNNYYQLSQEANDIAFYRAEKLINDLLEKIKQDNEELINSIKNPSIQMSIYEAQKSYIKDEDDTLEDNLIELLLERMKEKNKCVRQITLDETLKIIDKLTKDQIDVITIIFSCIYTSNRKVNSFQDLKNFIDKTIIPCVDSLKEFNGSSLEHLRYLGCIFSQETTRYPNIEDIYKERYQGLFYKGFTNDEFINEIANYNKYTNLIQPCLNDKTKFQFKLLNIESLKERKFNKNDEFEIINLINKSLLDNKEVKKILLLINPNMIKLINHWNNSEISKVTLSNVGKTIAFLNLKKLYDEGIKLEQWIN